MKVKILNDGTLKGTKIIDKYGNVLPINKFSLVGDAKKGISINFEMSAIDVEIDVGLNSVNLITLKITCPVCKKGSLFAYRGVMVCDNTKCSSEFVIPID